MDSVIRLVLRPDRHGRFEAYLGSELVCVSSQPLLDGARALLAAGHDPDGLLTTRYEVAGYDNFVPVPIGRLAGLTCDESALRFRKYAARPWRGGPPVRKSVLPVAGQP